MVRMMGCSAMGRVHPSNRMYPALVTAAVLATVGCSQKPEPVFAPLTQPLTWPPGAAAKIRYVGQLRTAADLKRPPKPFEALGNLLVGKKAPQPMYGPRSVVCTADGTRLWVADPGGRCLHVFDLAARTYKKIQRAGKAMLLGPVGLCLGPEDTIYVCDSEAVAIHRFSQGTGEFINSLRVGEDLLRPTAIHYKGGELYVVDVQAHNIKVLDSDGRLRRTIGRRGSKPGEFNFPSNITIAGDRIWIVDSGNHRVQALTGTGQPVLTIGKAGDAPGDLALPKGIALDREGHVYVVDGRFENVQIFDQQGRLLLFFGEEGTGPGEFWLPAGIFVDGNDRLWICDSYNGRIQVFDYLGATAEQERKP